MYPKVVSHIAAKHQRGVAGMQMGGVGDLVGHHGAADASMLRPALDAGLEEGAVEDQLPAAVEQVNSMRMLAMPWSRESPTFPP